VWIQRKKNTVKFTYSNPLGRKQHFVCQYNQWLSPWNWCWVTLIDEEVKCNEHFSQFASNRVFWINQCQISQLLLHPLTEAVLLQLHLTISLCINSMLHKICTSVLQSEGCKITQRHNNGWHTNQKKELTGQCRTAWLDACNVQQTVVTLAGYSLKAYWKPLLCTPYWWRFVFKLHVTPNITFLVVVQLGTLD